MGQAKTQPECGRFHIFYERYDSDSGTVTLAARGIHSFTDSITLCIHQALQTGWQLPAETIHIVMGVDVLAHAFHPRPELSDCLRPWRPGWSSGLPVPNPSDGSLVQHYLLAAGPVPDPPKARPQDAMGGDSR